MDILVLLSLTIFFITPGYILRQAFIKPPLKPSDWSDDEAIPTLQYDQSEVFSTSRVSSSLIWAFYLSIPLHLLWGWLFFFISSLREKNLYWLPEQLANCWPDTCLLTEILVRSVILNPNMLVLYTATLLLFSVILGSFANLAVCRLDFHKKYGWLGWNYDWPNVFYNNFHALDDQPFDFVVVTLTVEYPEATYIYGGILVKYRIHPDGKLYSITLQHAMRRRLKEDRQKENVRDKKPIEDPNADPTYFDGDRFYALTGEYCVILCDKVQTVNIDYFYIEKEDNIQ